MTQPSLFTETSNLPKGKLPVHKWEAGTRVQFHHKGVLLHGVITEKCLGFGDWPGVKTDDGRSWWVPVCKIRREA